MSKQKVRLDIYDDDGTHCETIIGKMDAEEVRAHMVDALSNDGIPVLHPIVSKDERTYTSDKRMEVKLDAGNLKFAAFGAADDVLDALNDVLANLVEADDE